MLYFPIWTHRSYVGLVKKPALVVVGDVDVRKVILPPLFHKHIPSSALLSFRVTLTLCQAEETLADIGVPPHLPGFRKLARKGVNR